MNSSVVKKISFIFAALWFFSAQARADVLVLVHGYLGNAYSWEAPGILQTLRQNDYRYAGILGYAHSGLVFQAIEPVAKNTIYSVNLPSQAFLPVQADWLNAYLQHIRARHPNQPLIVVAHSAGGVVARLALVRDQSADVGWLITIASPHQGTGRADQALSATNSGGWFGGMKSWLVRRQTGHHLYNTLKQSRGVLLDLTPPRPGNLLFWLNRQPHPAIRYTSVIRTGTPYAPGDPVVPPFSQDLCLIPAVAKHAERHLSQHGHLLAKQDGALLLQLLKGEAAEGACNPAVKRP